MAAVAAYLATIKVGTQLVGNITTYDMPFKMDMIDITAFSGASPGTHIFLPTLLGSQIKANGHWDKVDAGQVLLETAFFARTLVAVIFSPNVTNTYSYSAWIADYHVKADVKNVILADFTLHMNGNVTLV